MSADTGFHDTAITTGFEDGEEWADWVCTCGAGGDGLADRSAAIVATSLHRQDAS